MRLSRIILSTLVTLAPFFASGGVLKSIVYDFDGADIGQTDLPEGDYRGNDLTYKTVANPTGSGEMLGDRVLQLDLNWNVGNGVFGRGISRFIEFNPATDIFNFYFYNPTTNAADASFDVAITEDDDGNNTYSINSDDTWIKSLTVPRGSGWQLISVPLSAFTDGNAGGNGIFDATFTGAKGMLLMVEFRFKKNTTSNAVFYLDNICFSDGTLPTGATILDLPAPTMAGKCPLGAFEQKATGDQYLIPSDIEGMFPSMPKKIKYVNWFLQFAMDGSTTPKTLPGDEVSKLLAAGYRPIITWEPMFQGYDRLDPVQPRLSNIINGNYDSYFNSFADKVKSYNDTVVIRFMHEFEGNWYSWSITENNQDPSKYVAAFRKVVDIFRARGATKVKWMWCVNSDYFPYLSYNWVVPAYPGDNYVDIVATDVYNNHYPTALPWWRSFRWQTTESYYYLTKYFPNKPVMMCEEGCRERTSAENPGSETKAQWLAQMDKQLQTNYSKVKGLVFFSALHESDWRINSSSAALNSMANNIWNDDYYFLNSNTPPPPPSSACSASGNIIQEVWSNISGYSISSIPVNTAPSYTAQRTTFEEPSNAGDNYGSRMRGYICVPSTGNYTFWIASDDNSELWLSTDSTAAHKVRIAYVSGWTNPREWTKYATQQSAPVSLTAGKKYYIESLHKEGMQGDNLAVGWQLPNGVLERPIPGSRLSPATPSAPSSAQDLILANALWKYLDNGTDQGTSWRASSFSDASWKTGNAELGYGDGGEATVVSYGGNVNSKYITTYFRKSFNVNNPAAITTLQLSLVRDDGAVVYLNGAEVYRNNMPAGTISYTTLAPTAIGGSDESAWNTASINKASLLSGNNLLAVEIHQNARTSSDISFNLKLKGLAGGRIADTTMAIVTNDSISSANEYVLYPNPTTGQFSMEYCNYNVKDNSLELEIVNSIGQIIFQKKLAKTDACVREVVEFSKGTPPGIYIMNIISGDRKESKRIILSD